MRPRTTIGFIVSKDGCWNWIGRKNIHRKSPYGRLFVDGKEIQAHRWLYGDIPEHMELHHVCENSLCVNPAHLIEVSRWEHIGLSPNNIMFEKRIKTHCSRGHEFTPQNTYYSRSGRECRKCNMIHWHQWKERHAA
jgi:hypothetical protein